MGLLWLELQVDLSLSPALPPGQEVDFCVAQKKSLAADENQGVLQPCLKHTTQTH